MNRSHFHRYKAIISCIIGATSSLAFAPTYYLFLLPITFSSLLYLYKYCHSRKESFLLGWFFGFGYFFVGLYWISNALLVDKSFIWLIPIAATIIPSILGLYIGFITILAYHFKPHPLKLTMAFISLWVLMEIARTNLFTGFPWLSLGYTLSPFDIMLQSASIWGVFGLSFVVLLVSTIPFIIFCATKRTTIIYVSIVTTLVFSNLWYGHIKLQSESTSFTNYSALVVQPNISQELKWDKHHRHENLKKIMSMSKTDRHPKYIIWPEAAVPFLLNEKLRNHIKTIIPNDSYLITGGIRTSTDPNLKYWNSLFVLDHEGNLRSYYDKIHLVPFGEYIPMRNLLPLQKITYGTIDYSAGDTTNTVLMTGEQHLSFRPLICYESFFPTEILLHNQRPDILINITNDAWYGNSPGPYQHFDITRLRAIEYAIPLIRAANTGISAVISPTGAILQKIPLDKDGTIIENIPRKNKKTLYQLYGNFSVTIFSLVLLIMVLLI